MRNLIQQLKDLDWDGAYEIATAWAENKYRLTAEEFNIIKYKFIEFQEILLAETRNEDISEFLMTAKTCACEIIPAQQEALKKAYTACDYADWIGCVSALETLFGSAKANGIEDLDLSEWGYGHIMRWLKMFAKTKFYEKCESPAEMFLDKIIGQVLTKVPTEIEPILNEWFKDAKAEVDYLLDNSCTFTEEGFECIKFRDVSSFWGILIERLIEAWEFETGYFISDWWNISRTEPHRSKNWSPKF